MWEWRGQNHHHFVHNCHLKRHNVHNHDCKHHNVHHRGHNDGQIGVQVEYKLEMARGFVKKGEEARFLLSSSLSSSTLSSSSSPASSLFKQDRNLSNDALD